MVLIVEVQCLKLLNIVEELVLEGVCQLRDLYVVVLLFSLVSMAWTASIVFRLSSLRVVLGGGCRDS